jgi:ATP-dependent DNA helicase RecG
MKVKRRVFRNLLTVLSRISPASLSEIRQYLPLDYPKRTIQDNLQVLKILELIDSNGHGAGAKWILK